MTVIDASALTKFLLKEEGWEEVTPYLEAGTASIGLVVKEAANAVWKMSRRGAVSAGEAEAILQALKKITGSAVKIEDELGYMDEAVKIAFSRNISVYDSLYVAAAKMKRSNLLTADETQAKAAEAENITVKILK